MWFNQTTCDTCFNVMPVITRQNKYYYSDIILSEPLHSILGQNAIKRLPDNSLDMMLVGKYKSFKVKTGSFNSGAWGTFCSVRCAIQFSKTHNCALLFFSERNFAVSLILPIMEDFNETPISVKEWPEYEWFCQFYDIVDLSRFGSDSCFPEFDLGDIKLAKPTRSSTRSLCEMIYTENFMTMFYGSYDQKFAETQKHLYLSRFEDNLKKYDKSFGRRLEIEWHIVDKKNDFIGFIRLTRLHPAFEGKWVLEFGMLPKYEHKGIMSKSINAVLNWTKAQGCTDLYAISEFYNNQSHSVFNRMNFDVETTTALMFDEYAGQRRMYNYHIRL